MSTMGEAVVVCLTEAVVSGLIDHPEELQIIVSNDTVTLSVHPDDTGKVIGKNGRTINAIRAIIRSVGKKHGGPTLLNIAESKGELK